MLVPSNSSIAVGLEGTVIFAFFPNQRLTFLPHWYTLYSDIVSNIETEKAIYGFGFPIYSFRRFRKFAA